MIGKSSLSLMYFTPKQLNKHYWKSKKKQRLMILESSKMAVNSVFKWKEKSGLKRSREKSKESSKKTRHSHLEG